MIKLFGPPTVSYCEKISSALISRPWAALSNLVYFLVAYLIWKNAKNSKVAKQFAYVIFIVATFSFIYDIKAIYLTQIFDLSGMMILISFLLFLDLSKLLNYHSNMRLIITLTSLTVAAIVAIIAIKGVAGNVIFGSFVLAEVIVQDMLFKKKLNHDYKYWVAGFLIFAFGFLLWIPDLNKSICAPLALFNGRPLFHYCVAITLYLLAEFYKRNEV